MNNYIPGPKYNKFPVKTPLMVLQEALHNFKRNDNEYDSCINNAAKQIVLDLKSKNNLIKLLRSENNLYAKQIIRPDIENLDECKIYITINQEFEGNDSDMFNITDDYRTYAFSNIITGEYPLYKKNDDGKYIVTILGAMSNDMLDNLNAAASHIAMSIKHELIHIMHELKGLLLNINAGLSYSYAEKILNKYNLTFPRASTYSEYIWKNTSITEQYLNIITGCMYYFCPGEINAWIETFTKESRREIAVGFTRGLAIQEIYKSYNNSQTFKLFSQLSKLLNDNAKDIQQFININPDIKAILKAYMSHIGKTNTRELIGHWKKQVQKFIKNCKVIHVKRAEELNHILNN